MQVNLGEKCLSPSPPPLNPALRSPRHSCSPVHPPVHPESTTGDPLKHLPTSETRLPPPSQPNLSTRLCPQPNILTTYKSHQPTHSTPRYKMAQTAWHRTRWMSSKPVSKGSEGETCPSVRPSRPPSHPSLPFPVSTASGEERERIKTEEGEGACPRSFRQPRRGFLP